MKQKNGYNSVLSDLRSYLLSMLADRSCFTSLREMLMKPSLLGEKNPLFNKIEAVHNRYPLIILANHPHQPCSAPDHILVASVLHTCIPLTPETLSCQLQEDRLRLPPLSYGGLQILLQPGQDPRKSREGLLRHRLSATIPNGQNK